jgi:hypothetical protein
MYVLFAISALAIFYSGYSCGKNVGLKERVIPVTRCHAYAGIIDDWMKKNVIIHRLETRICRLKKANRNLRSEIKQVKQQPPTGAKEGKC